MGVPARSNEENLTLARTLADFFRGFLRPVAAATGYPPEEVELIDYALVHLDRYQLWNLYLRQRAERTRALRELNPDTSADLKFDRVYYVHAFIARALVTPAHALKGCARHHLDKYLEEGMEYAAHVLSDDEQGRRDLVTLWSEGAPLTRNRNLDRLQEDSYVTGDGNEGTR